MKRYFIVSIIGLLGFATIASAQEHRFTIDELLKVRRVGDSQVSPKGDLVAFTITDMSVAANKGTTQIYVVPLSGGEVRQLTNDEHSSASDLIIGLLGFATIASAQEHRFTIDELLKVRRVGDSQVSPKGDLVAFTITDMSVAANKGTTQIYVVPLSGGEVRQLTNDEHSSA